MFLNTGLVALCRYQYPRSYVLELWLLYSVTQSPRLL